MTKDLITITLEREKAEYLAACFEDDLKWLGVTAGIDRGLCYHDFIKQVKKHRRAGKGCCKKDYSTNRNGCIPISKEEN